MLAASPDETVHRALVVDDDPALIEVVTQLLERHEFSVTGATTAALAMRVLAEESPDLVILDLALRRGIQDSSGEELCTRIRQDADVPILVLSAQRADDAKARLFKSGADDYLTKPFGGEELVARARALLRRGPLPSATVHLAGGLRVDPARWRVDVNGRVVHLSPTQFRLLTVLVRRANEVVTRLELLAAGWPQGVTDPYALKPHLREVRRKLAQVGGPRIENVRGIGYRLVSVTKAAP